MEKQIIILIVSLILASHLTALEGVRGEYFFRPTFQKKLKRVKPVVWHSFRSLGLKQACASQKGNKKAIFIDWRKLYWGKLSDLIYGAEEPCDEGIKGIAVREEQNALFDDTEDLKAFVKELRQELKSFAKQYGLKIIWRKKPLDLMDGTAAFLEYWDKGFSQEKQEKVLSFDDLCALSVRNTNAKDMGPSDTNIPDTSIRNISSNKETKTKGASAPNSLIMTMLFADFSCGYAPFVNVPCVKKGA